MGISLMHSCMTGESDIAYLCCISLKHIYIAYRCCRIAVFYCLGLGSIFGRFGGVLGRFLVVLGGLRGVLGCLWRVLGGLLGVWGRLGAVLGGLEAVLARLELLGSILAQQAGLDTLT